VGGEEGSGGGGRGDRSWGEGKEVLLGSGEGGQGVLLN